MAGGIANNGMTDAERAAIDVNGQEHAYRVIGSQIQVAGWTIYSALIWSLKLSVLFFYLRLTVRSDDPAPWPNRPSRRRQLTRPCIDRKDWVGGTGSGFTSDSDWCSQLSSRRS